MLVNPTIAILGANGFIGNRLVEVFHLRGKFQVRPIVRRPSALALAARFDIEGRIADAFDVLALEDAFRGCEVVVHAIAGDSRTIVGSVAPVYAAAARARCRRIVYLSSAMVHGQAPSEGTDELSRLSLRQPLKYNVSKIKAENTLFALRRKGSVEAVALRPGIVYGPRSGWVGSLAEDILASRAYLVDGGRGLCNAIHVDNVVHAVELACRVKAADGEAFLLGENSTMTWRTFYERVASALGRAIADIPSVPFEVVPTSWKDRLDSLRLSRPVQSSLEKLPKPLREGLAGFWAATGMLPDDPTSTPKASLEMALLHTSRHLPSWTKAQGVLGYQPVLAQEPGWRNTIEWLTFANYPVVQRLCG